MRFTAIGPTRGDETTPYEVWDYTSKTVREFVQEVIKGFPNEWGCIRVKETEDNGFLSSPEVCEYKYGEIVKSGNSDLLDLEINKIEACGGWSSMDYLIWTTETRKLEKNVKKPRVYISGPISNTNREECFEAFRKAEEFLESIGYRAFSPLKNGLPFEADVHLHMRRDLNILTNEEDPFDYIYMLRRWPHSSGCKTELDNAVASGITVVFEESNEAIKFA